MLHMSLVMRHEGRVSRMNISTPSLLEDSGTKSDPREEIEGPTFLFLHPFSRYTWKRQEAQDSLLSFICCSESLSNYITSPPSLTQSPNLLQLHLPLTHPTPVSTPHPDPINLLSRECPLQPVCPLT